MSPLNINPVPPPLLLYTNNLNLNQINNQNQKMNIIAGAARSAGTLNRGVPEKKSVHTPSNR